MTTLDWYLEESTPVRRWAASLLTEAIGLSPAFRDLPGDGSRPSVYHGPGTPPAGRTLHIPALAGTEAPIRVTVDGSPTGARLDGDVLDGTVALLTDRVNASTGTGARDRHGRLRADASWQGRHGALIEPLVNAYAERLAVGLGRIGSSSGVPRWPEGRKAAIGLSHDVDRPDKYAILRAVRQGRVPPPGRIPWYAARSVRDLAHRLRDPAPNDFWLFDEVVAAEAERGLRSTFLFSVVPAYGRYGSTNDVLYDAAWPHLRQAMADLRARGIEIGLHASYNAHREPRRFVEERARLVELSGGPVTGLRHHFWQVGPRVEATLRAHEAAGFRYDSSIAFNEVVGLRRSIALAYRPWDPEQERPLDTWQLPVLALDSAVCATAPSVEAGIERVWEGVEAIIASGGIGVLDWHVRCSVPANRRYRAWGEIYLGILDRLAARPDVWATGLGEIVDWVEERTARLAARP